jgi:predicted outer membrane repeat protein
MFACKCKAIIATRKTLILEMKMQKNIITILLIFQMIQMAQANNWLDLKPDSQMRLSQALELSHSNKAVKNKQGTNFVTVGDGNDCDFRLGTTKIQSAINSGATEIRIASNDTYEEIISINNPAINLTLRGGFANCTDADNNIQSNNPQDYTQITRADGLSGSVFNINALPQGNTTTFENLKIIGGNGQNATSGGSIQLGSTDSDVVLNNMWLTQGINNATGGGLSIISSNSTVILNNSAIFENIANQGGGIYCNDFSGLNKRATIILADDSRLDNNSSVVNAGGAYISTGCFLASFAGNATANMSLGIFSNKTDGDGGGIYANNGANILIFGHTLCDLTGACFGNTLSPASVNLNSANDDFLTANSGDENGGGIYATGVGTDVTITAGYLIANTTNGGLGGGGAVAVFDTASITVNHPGLDCWSLEKCNSFDENTAHFGGAIYSNESTVNVSHTFFENNRANSGLIVFSSGGSTTIESSVVFNNGNDGVVRYSDNYLFSIVGGNEMNILHSTIANNFAETAVFIVSAISVGTTLNLHSSIVHDQNSGDIISPSSGVVSSNCNITHEIISLTGTNNIVDDPEFVNSAQGDYHLQASSPAVDYCHQILTTLNKDIEFQEQGYDILSISNFLGSYDIGADEFYDKTFLTVGGDAACDINTATQSIQDAIDTGIGEIRVASNGAHNSTMTVDDLNLKLRGGYVDCDAANNDIQTTETELIVTGGLTEPVISISGDDQRNTIELENFIMTGQGTSAVDINVARADITLTNILIHNNNLAPGFLGGGVFISQSDVNLKMIDTLITENSATHGGGIFCEGLNANVVMSGNSGLSLNTTTGKGGGAYITLGCQFTMYSGTANPNVLSTTGISSNKADEEGGGIYVDLGGQVTLNGHEDCSQTCIGDNTNPVNINENQSNADNSVEDEDGGGIYMTGLGTEVNIYAGLITRNFGQNGGGVYVNDLASLTVARLMQDCWDLVKCNYFLQNIAPGIGTGGAIQNDQGFVNISNTYFEENIGRTGSALFALGSNSHNKIDSSVFNHNNDGDIRDKYVIRATNSASVEIVHSTFADNIISDSAVFGISTSSELRLLSSIVHEQQGDVLDVNPGTIIIDCLMAHETSSFTGTNVFLADPGFIDRDNRDYHLTAVSLAVDVCIENSLIPGTKDIDFESRGMQSHLVSNINGPFDLGADETEGSDILFINSFED